MRLPRFRIRTLMIAVAVVAVLLVALPPWWRYWFHSPWRLVTVRNYTSPDGSERFDELKYFFDTRKPSDFARMQLLLHDCQAARADFSVERFATFPRSRFPQWTDAVIRRIDPSWRDPRSSETK
jgi:hypothetical protein